MLKKLLTPILILLCGICEAQTVVRVAPTAVLGPVKIMNAANNGPVYGDREAYKALRVPYARTHDTVHGGGYGYQCVDITRVFPDFDADVDSPSSYDFDLTDEVLLNMQKAGTKPFYRLGQSIEHYSKKYGIYPPKDFEKWARVCEHIIRHYNEGWADGFHYNIKYWEIWNEPNLEWDNDKWKVDPRCWAGSPEQFYDFFEVAVKHLKGCFPNLLIGGPAMSGQDPGVREIPVWYELLLSEMKRRNVPLDFFAWHIYEYDPTVFTDFSYQVRALLDKYGYDKAESFLNEWNYIKSWTDDYPYSARMMSSPKAGAFVCASMQEGQNCPTDMMMYYDWRPGTVFNGLFDIYSDAPLWSYWALYAWGKLKTLGTQIKAECNVPDVRVTAARDAEGHLGILVSRYVLDDNITAVKDVTVSLADGKFDGKVRCHIADQFNMYTEYPVALQPDGTLVLAMDTNSFVLIEY